MRKTTMRLLVALALVAGVVACGSDDEPAPAADTGASDAAVAAAEAEAAEAQAQADAAAAEASAAQAEADAAEAEAKEAADAAAIAEAEAAAAAAALAAAEAEGAAVAELEAELAAAQEAAAAAEAEAEAAAAAAEEAAAEQAAAAPSEIDVAMLVVGTKEEGWYATFIDSVNRVSASNKYGITINLEILEGIQFVEGERVIRDLAQTGEYEIIVGHSTYVDGVAANKADFPDTLFVYSGSGNDDHDGGDNAYWIDVFIHEPAYLAGIIAGMTTQTNRISGVAAYPFPNVNAPLNAFVDGARSVNPDIEVAGVTYIESWFDPATASAAAEAQIANGSDVIYAERFGPFNAAEDAGNVRAVGHFTDQLSLSPVVLTSAVAQWDTAFSDVLDAWYDYTVHGVPYNSPPQRIVYQSMVDDGSSLGAIADDIPADVVAAVEAARVAILSGELVVPLNFDRFE
ncbi:MAG: BMP family ABC transporter substrate-binding protein [Acidimicrobiaceae bacterium]|nr:BMP family ABC transporter substrate-binding protein [Acidimicrobiaceae bacterium]MXY11950.1 BMP family ABC transporter substrate-binding protein [Acidimicrobiaceae bacterium]MYG79878.1 BMP family ABC transporter substrate-binding protein [Acidimicrobiaceae bacterium]MYJ82776.1 BMP family ABC transporter substrate-binding protein [Acidimicrobiaceae bacterium]